MSEDANVNATPEVAVNETNPISELSSEEQAYFDNRGETESQSEETQATESQQEEASTEGVTDEAQEKTESKVPLQALHEERYKRKEVQKQLNEYKEKMAKLEGRFETLEKLAQGATKEPEMPSFEDAPELHLKAENEMTKKELQQLKEWKQQQEQQLKQQQEFATTVNEYKSQAQEYMKQAPDFMDAYQHLINFKKNEMKTFGYNDAQADAAVANLEMDVINRARELEQNPAEMLYNYAKSVGYAKKVEGTATNNNTTNVGQNVSKKSLSSANGSGIVNKITPEMLADMSDDEFAQYTAGDKWKRLFK